ncbi:MAG: hypothetical protein JSU66_07575, partial [Deltaproteobacteria bacterium]
MSRRERWLAAVLPPALVAILYGRTAGFEFVWDDKLWSTLPVYASFDLAAILTSPANGVEYLPVRDLTLVLDHALFGSWAGGFHITNAVLFAGAAWLAFGLYRVLFEASPDVRVARAG